MWIACMNSSNQLKLKKSLYVFSLLRLCRIQKKNVDDSRPTKQHNSLSYIDFGEKKTTSYDTFSDFSDNTKYEYSYLYYNSNTKEKKQKTSFIKS